MTRKNIMDVTFHAVIRVAIFRPVVHRFGGLDCSEEDKSPRWWVVNTYYFVDMSLFDCQFSRHPAFCWTICEEYAKAKSLLLLDTINVHVNLLIVETNVTSNRSRPTQISASVFSKQGAKWTLHTYSGVKLGLERTFYSWDKSCNSVQKASRIVIQKCASLQCWRLVPPN